MLQLNFLKQINPRMNFLFYFFPNSVWGFSSLYSTKTNWYLLGNNIPRGFRKIVNIFCFLFAYLLHLFLLCEQGPADECLIFFWRNGANLKDSNSGVCCGAERSVGSGNNCFRQRKRFRKRILTTVSGK